MIWDNKLGAWVQRPSETQHHFKKGVGGNPSGHSNQTRAMHHLNAKKASFLRQELLEALESKIMTAKVTAELEEGEVVPDGGMPRQAANRIAQMITPDINRILSDSEDRGFGKPTQPTRDDSPPKKDIQNDMTPQEAAEAYQNEISQK